MCAAEGDPDDGLVPLMVTRIVIAQKVLPMLRDAWDPTSRAQSLAVRDLVSDLLAFSDDSAATGPAFQRLVEALKAALLSALDKCEERRGP